MVTKHLASLITIRLMAKHGRLQLSIIQVITTEASYSIKTCYTPAIHSTVGDFWNLLCLNVPAKMYKFTPYLGYKHENKKESCEQHNPSREDSIADVNVAPKRKCDKDKHHKDDAWNVDQCCNKLRVVEDRYLHFPGLEGKNNAHNLQQCQVEEDEQITVESRRSWLIADPHIVFFTNP